MKERGITITQLRHVLDELEQRTPAESLPKVRLVKNKVGNLAVLDCSPDGCALDDEITYGDYVGYIDLRYGEVHIFEDGR